MIEKNLKVTILKNEGILVDLLAESNLHNDNDIYTDIPIDENSEFIVDDEDEDEEIQFYATSLDNLIEKYKSITLQKIKIK
jgi:hypothetical protein